MHCLIFTLYNPIVQWFNSHSLENNRAKSRMNNQKIIADLQSIAFYEGAKNIYAQVRIRETLKRDFRVIDESESKISILIPSNEENRLQTAKIIAAAKRTIAVTIDVESRSETQDRFGKTLGRYVATIIEQYEEFRL